MKIESFPFEPIEGKNNNNESKEKDDDQNSNDSTQNLLEQIEITNNLKLLLKQKNLELEKIKDDNIKIVNNINNEIIEKNIKIDSLTKNTTLLLNKLNSINKNIDLQYAKYNIDKKLEKKKLLIKKDKVDTVKKLRINILSGKNSIKHNQKIIDMLKSQKQKLELLLAEDTEHKIIEYKNILENLNKKEKEIEYDIYILKNIKIKHIKFCDKKNEYLINILKRIQKEYDFETKKCNSKKNIDKKTKEDIINYHSNEDKKKIAISKFVSNIDNNIDYKFKTKKSFSFKDNDNNHNLPLPQINKNKIKILIGENQKLNLNEESNSKEKYKSFYLRKNTAENSNTIKNTYRDKNIFQKPLIKEYYKFTNNKSFHNKNLIKKDLIELKKQILLVKNLKNKKIQNNYSTNSLFSNININAKANDNKNSYEYTNININNYNTLFSNTERNFLSKIIPNECIENCQKKYNNIEEQRLILKEKLKDNITLKKKNEEQNNKVELTELIKKTNNQKMIQLHSKLSEIKKNIANIKTERNNFIKRNIDTKKKYIKGKNENDKLMKILQDLYNDIKNNKKKLIKGKTLNDEELEFINKANPNDGFTIRNNNDNEKKEKGYDSEEIEDEEDENEITDS